MSEFDRANFRIAIARSRIVNFSHIDKFGANDTVGTSDETIWHYGGLYNWLTAPTAIKITSSNSNEVHGGGGVHTIRLEGLNANYEVITETISLNGHTAVTTVNTFQRLYRMNAVSVGNSLVNVGQIYGFTGDSTDGVPDTATQVYASMPAEHGQTLLGAYTIPVSKTGYIAHIHAEVGAGKNADVRFFTRPLSESFKVFTDFDILNDHFSEDITVPLKVDAKTDIEIRAKVDAGSTKVSGGFLVILVDEIE
jgi:hypothetical protein